MKTHRLERGQALVLIVLAIVAMFGFAALAVDIGRVYAERRRAQNAADSAALAAVYAASQSQNFEDAAFAQLGLNDVFDTDPDRNEDLRVDVELYHPPESGAYGPDSGRSLTERNQYYQVVIHSAVDQIFSQFVFQGPLTVTVEAVGRVRQASSLFAGDVLHATSPTACQGIKFAGTGSTLLQGGDAYSDSSAGDACPGSTGKGGASCTSAALLGNGSVTIPDGTVILAGEWGVSGKGQITTENGSGNNAGVVECAIPRDLPTVPQPDCSIITAPVSPQIEFLARTFTEPKGKKESKNVTLYPGVYAGGIKMNNKDTVAHLEPGLYCLDDDLTITGGTFTGDGVMIYMRNGQVQTVGNAVINLSYGDVSDAQGDTFWPRMLLYMPYENTNEVHLGGGSDSVYSGTIYAPGPRPTSGQDKCIILGNGVSLGFNANIICDTIKITGNANVTVDYNEDLNHQMPPFIELAQ